jgi:hypothetical protein
MIIIANFNGLYGHKFKRMINYKMVLVFAVLLTVSGIILFFQGIDFGLKMIFVGIVIEIIAVIKISNQRKIHNH